MPHTFYSIIEAVFPATPAGTAAKLLAERLVHGPLMTALLLFVTKWLSGKPFGKAARECRALLPGAIVANWKFWTPAIIVNLLFVKPEFRVLFASVVAFVWTVYLASVSKRPVRERAAQPKTDQ